MQLRISLLKKILVFENFIKKELILNTIDRKALSGIIALSSLLTDYSVHSRNSRVWFEKCII